MLQGLQEGKTQAPSPLQKETAIENQSATRQARGAPGGGIEAVRVWLLGDFRVTVGDRSIGEEQWHLKKAASLIKLLALAPGHQLHREQASDFLWPDLRPEAATNNLHQALHVARRTLEPPAPPGAASRYLQLRGGRLALCAQGELWIDVEAFEEATALARHTLEPAAFRAAIELYRGELLPQDRYEGWVERRRAELRGAYLSLLLELAGLYEERGQFGEAIAALSRLVAQEPTQEEAHAGLMRLYALSGRPHQALVQYASLREILSRVLDKDPGDDTRRLYQEIRVGSFPRAAPARSPSSAAGRPPEEEPAASSRHNLPGSLTSFVGREREMLELKRALSMTRLLTLTGMGGVGKTRFALEAARELVGAYPDGVWLVELAPLSEGVLVPQAVAQALGVSEQPGLSVTQTLSDHLRPRRALLVLDNCEHLIDAAALLADALLKACPKLRVLATSREPLGVPGEVVWAVPALSLPNGGGDREPDTVEGLMRTEAVRLFVDRTRSRLPDFELTQENAGAVSRVSRKLEGLPLAIELAAARMGALAVEQVAQRLEDSLGLLTGGSRTLEPRQRTLRATLAWSYGLLSDAERALFARLSVFAGGWTPAAAEEVCSGAGIEREDVVDVLSTLVDKSLVVAGARVEAEVRYRMLEPVRQYGRERLEEDETAERVRERHIEYYLALAEGADAGKGESSDLRSGRPLAWFKQMESEHGNLRAALSWSLEEDTGIDGGRAAELGLRLAVALWWFWHTHEHQIEGRRYLERAVSRTSGDPTTTRLRARALSGASWLALYQADIEASKTLIGESLSLYRELGDKEGIASGLTDLGYVAVVGQRDDIPLQAVIEELMELKPHVKNRNTLGYLLILEGIIAASQRDWERSVALHEESLDLFRQIDDTQGIITCGGHLGLLAMIQGKNERALRLLRESLRHGWEADAKVIIQTTLHGLAGVAASLGQPLHAARLWGTVEGMQEAYGVYRAPVTLQITDYEGRLAAARSQVDESYWLGAWEEGKAMSLGRAIEYALSAWEERDPPTVLTVPGQRPPADGGRHTLTRREQEVAFHVAWGLTNRQIASELSLSERTVENHVRKILKKLGFSSRTQIAAHLAQR